MLDPAVRDLAAIGANFAVLSVILPNGQIASHVMWIDATDEQLLINTEIDRAKYRAVQQHPDVTVTIWDASDPYRYAEVRGRVSGQVRGDEARAHIDALSQRYRGRDYDGVIRSERVVLRIDPVRQRIRG
jgi:PPOX class probable F420-dependent enzyme